MTDILGAALEYHRAGFNVLPIRIDGSKAPACRQWRKYYTDGQTEEEITELFAKPCGIGIIGGPLSGELEIIDFDRAGAFEQWRELVADIAPDLLARLPIVATPKGHHVYLRSPLAEGNQKLAEFPSVGEDGKNKKGVISETRGKGGYVLAPPSPGGCHPSGKTYEHIAGPHPRQVPTLTLEERELLLSAARSFTEVVQETKEERKGHTNTATGEGRPGDEYERLATWSEILNPHGWQVVRARGSVTYWRRPGKDDTGISATTGTPQCGEKLYVFSSNASPFDSGHAYSKFRAFAILNHGSNWTAASRELRDRGLGTQHPPHAKPAPSPTWDTLAAPPHTDADVPHDVDHEERQDATPALVDPEIITAEEIERTIDDDIGKLVVPRTLDRCIHTRAHSPSEWIRVCDTLRRKKVRKDFEGHLKSYEQRKKNDPKRFYNGSAWKAQLVYRENKNGEMMLENINANLVTILQHDPAWVGVLAFDEFSNQIVTLRPAPFREESRRRWADEDAYETKAWLEVEHGMRPTTGAVFEAILTVAKRSRFNAVQNYLNDLEAHTGDNEGALDTWLIDVFGCPDTPYVRAVGVMWMISAVARAYEPGCKADAALILEGDQGLKKSRVLGQLCPVSAWFTDGLSDFGSKAQAEEVEGKWIIELGELKGFGRELEQIKAFITRQNENYRPAYGRYSMQSPRKCVFAGTINPGANGYLRDETGNRRFWPVVCTKRAPELSPELRDRLWAEAKARYQAGEKWWFEPGELEEEAKQEQAKRVEVDVWQELIEPWVQGKSSTTTHDILHFLNVDSGRRTRGEQMRVGRIMRMLGWPRRQQMRNGVHSWIYVNPIYDGPGTQQQSLLS